MEPITAFAMNFLSGLAKDKLTTAAGVGAAAVAGSLPAMADGQPMTLSDDPTILLTQVISGIVALVLMYWDRKREKQQ